MSDINWRGIIFWILVALALMLSLIAIVTPASAYPYVEQGNNVTQGKAYDLSGVAAYGEYYGEFAYWKDWWQEGGTATPTIINRVEPRFLFSVCIDEKRWKVGNWYKYNGDKPAPNENNFAFRVIKSNVSTSSCIGTTDPTPVPTAIIYDISGTPVPVTNTGATIVETPFPTSEPTPMGTIQLPPTAPRPTIKQVVVVGVTPTFPPPRGLPVSPLLGIIGVIGAIIIASRR